MPEAENNSFFAVGNANPGCEAGLAVVGAVVGATEDTAVDAVEGAVVGGTEGLGESVGLGTWVAVAASGALGLDGAVVGVAHAANPRTSASTRIFFISSSLKGLASSDPILSGRISWVVLHRSDSNGYEI